MPFDSTETSSAGAIRLPEEFYAKIQAYQALRATRKAANEAAAAAEEAMKAARGELLKAMSGAPAAVCGDLVLTLKETAAAQAAVTLRDGRKIKWPAIEGILIDNDVVPACDVLSLYGGRAGSTDLQCQGR